MNRRAAIHLGHLVSVLIIAFWAAMTFALVRDSILPRRQAIRTFAIDPSLFGEAWQDIDEHYRIVTEQPVAGRGGERQIGGARVRITRTQRPIGFRADFALRLGLRLLQRDLGVTVQVAVQLDDAFELADFHARLEGLKTRLHLEGTVINDERLLLRATTGGRGPRSEQARAVLPLTGPVSLLESVRPLVVRGREVRVGDGFSIDVIDPVWQMSRGELLIVAEAEETLQLGAVQHRAIRLRNEFAGQRTLSWVTPDGRLLRREIMPGRGLFMEVVSGDEAIRRYREFLDEQLEIERMTDAEFEGLDQGSFDDFATLSIFADLDIIPEVPTR